MAELYDRVKPKNFILTKSRLESILGRILILSVTFSIRKVTLELFRVLKEIMGRLEKLSRHPRSGDGSGDRSHQTRRATLEARRHHGGQRAAATDAGGNNRGLRSQVR